MASQKKPLSDFTKLSITTSLYTPPPITTSTTSPSTTSQTTSSNSQTNTKNGEPTLIILCTWAGGATPSRISKYTSGYQSILPSTPILLIEAHPINIALMPFAIPMGRFYTEAVKVISDHLGRFTTADSSSSGEGGAEASKSGESGGGPQLLLHLFSHGGCKSFLDLNTALKANRLTLPLIGLVFDSCPSTLNFATTWNALQYNLPEAAIPRALASIPVAAALGHMALSHQIGVPGIKDGEFISRETNRFLPPVKRLYLLGKEDDIVNWRDSWRHAEDAKRLYPQIDISMVLFDHGSHCALILSSPQAPQRYWAAVRQLCLPFRSSL